MSDPPNPPDPSITPNPLTDWFPVVLHALNVGNSKAATTLIDEFVTELPDPASRAARCLVAGQLLESHKHFDHAERYLRRGLSYESTDERTCYFLNNNVGFLLNLRGEHAEAEPFCRAAIRHDPLRHNAYKNLGIALAGLGQPGEAARNLILATRACPEDPRAYRLLLQLVADHGATIRAFDPNIDSKLQILRLAVGAPEESESQ